MKGTRPPDRSARRRALLWVSALLGSVALLTLAPPLAFLGWAWVRDVSQPLPFAAVGSNDACGLNPNHCLEVIEVAADPAEATAQLIALVERASREQLHISIRGAGHSMGGHTLCEDGIALDMRPFQSMQLDAQRNLLVVGAGARWSDVIAMLDRWGKSVAVMQSNNDFTVGGSISVNCHGWQLGSPPIASTVESFRLLTADAQLLRCSRTENSALFSLALGGYGLFGVILDVELRIVDNEFYRSSTHMVKTEDYARSYDELTRARSDLGMAYGRISVAPDSFFEEALIVLLERDSAQGAASDTLAPAKYVGLKRTVFRASVGSDYGKNLRWRLERWWGETALARLSRNQILDEPVARFGLHDPEGTEILQEYFIPKQRLGEFAARCKVICEQHRPELLNVTVREVHRDVDTLLCYAREDVFGVVLLLHQERDAAAEAAMAAFAVQLTDAALACGGTYYLTYRPHASVEQFERGYPMAREFLLEKLARDPGEVFTNHFHANYGRALLAGSQEPR
jgi:FAD/FMN-containing dehydrogenase